MPVLSHGTGQIWYGHVLGSLDYLLTRSRGLAVPLGITRALDRAGISAPVKKTDPFSATGDMGLVTRAYQDNLDYSGSSSEQRPNE